MARARWVVVLSALVAGWPGVSRACEVGAWSLSRSVVALGESNAYNDARDALGELGELGVTYVSLPELTAAGLDGVQVLYIDGRWAGGLSEDEQDALYHFVLDGGTLIAHLGVTASCTDTEIGDANTLAQPLSLEVSCVNTNSNIITYAVINDDPVFAGVTTLQNRWEAVSISGPGDLPLEFTGAEYVANQPSGAVSDTWAFIPRGVLGDGQVLAFGNGHAFTDAHVGDGGLLDLDSNDNETLLLNLVESGCNPPPPVTTVDIDIKPGSDPNCFNSDGHGAIPVAILSSADFDATTVLADTVLLDGQELRTVGKADKLLAHEEDVNGDGLLDLVVQIEDVDGTYAEGTTEGVLTGVTTDGTEFEGTDSICIVP